MEATENTVSGGQPASLGVSHSLSSPKVLTESSGLRSALRLGSFPGQRRSQAWNLIRPNPNSRDTLLSRDALLSLSIMTIGSSAGTSAAVVTLHTRAWAQRRSRVFVNRRPSHLTTKNPLPEDLHLTAHLAGLSCIHQRSSRKT